MSNTDNTDNIDSTPSNIKDNIESNSLSFTLPISPSINDYYGHICRSNTPIEFVKTRGKQYRTKVKEIIETSNLNIGINIPIKVSVTINYKTRHRNDLDNRMKGLLDALTHAKVWEDDSLIDQLIITRGKVDKKGTMHVLIEEYNAS